LSGLKYEVMNTESFPDTPKLSPFPAHPTVLIPVFISRHIILPFKVASNDNHTGGSIGL